MGKENATTRCSAVSWSNVLIPLKTAEVAARAQRTSSETRQRSRSPTRLTTQRNALLKRKNNVTNTIKKELHLWLKRHQRFRDLRLYTSGGRQTDVRVSVTFLLNHFLACCMGSCRNHSEAFVMTSLFYQLCTKFVASRRV